jgi:hypothetical protein
MVWLSTCKKTSNRFGSISTNSTLALSDQKLLHLEGDTNMPIRPEHEKLFPLAKAGQHVPGGPVHVSTLHRWRLRGCRGVRLETVTVGGRRLTSREAILRFIQATTQAADGSGCPLPSESKARQKAIVAAEKRCREFGVH